MLNQKKSISVLAARVRYLQTVPWRPRVLCPRPNSDGGPLIGRQRAHPIKGCTAQGGLLTDAHSMQGTVKQKRLVIDATY
jgi:hypothetical protein